MDILWRGSWATRARIASGLVLFAFISLHLVNVGLGLVSPQAMDRMQEARQIVTRSLPGTVLLYAAMTVHMALALSRLATRRTLRMPPWQWAQVVLGFTVPVLAIVHVIHTRLAYELYDVNDRMGYLIALIWNTPSAWKQSLLLLIAWTHGCIGLHFWLRGKRWWPRALPWMMAVAALVPALALAGFATEGRRLAALLADPDARLALATEYHWPDAAVFAELADFTRWATWTFWGLLALALGFHAFRWLADRLGHKVRVRYIDGPEVTAPQGPTLLEISRANGVPHLSLCGGRGRCTTCRVIVEEGADLLAPPDEVERRSLEAVNAPPGTRLACQMRPAGRTTVFRVFRADGRRRRAHATQGREQRLAVLFLDMRGFTGRTAGQLPYDVVFLLNRFFDAIVPPILDAGGTVDKYLGDGLLAVFETQGEGASARAALRAAAGISSALARFNRDLSAEGTEEVRIGMGLHLGNLVLGEIGAAGDAPRTIIGDTVNVASRLEGETKGRGVMALASESLLRCAGADVAALELLTLDLRGVREPVRALAVSAGAELEELVGEGTHTPRSGG